MADHTMTVFPLYWMMWHDRPTSFPPPKQVKRSSSLGSTGSSEASMAGYRRGVCGVHFQTSGRRSG
jgi:hypothetical protein